MHAVVVLGCPALKNSAGALRGAAGRRAVAAAAAYVSHASQTLVVSGGRTWAGRVEADAIAEELARLGVASEAVVRERLSYNTRENARYTAELLERRGITEIVLVTCSWHMPRAVSLFRREGLAVHPEPVREVAGLGQRAYRSVREAVANRLDHAALAWSRR